MPIITATEYKTSRGITGTDYDTVIGNAITSRQSWLEEQCGRKFDSDDYTDEAYCGDGTPRLWLGNWPVTALTSVKIMASDGTTTTLDSDSYRLVDEQYIVRLKGSDYGWGVSDRTFGDYGGDVFPEGDGNVLVTYTGGYTTHPDSLKDLMYELVDIHLDERGHNSLLQQTGDGVVQRTRMSRADRVATLADMVRPWKRVAV